MITWSGFRDHLGIVVHRFQLIVCVITWDWGDGPLVDEPTFRIPTRCERRPATDSMSHADMTDGTRIAFTVESKLVEDSSDSHFRPSNQLSDLAG